MCDDLCDVFVGILDPSFFPFLFVPASLLLRFSVSCVSLLVCFSAFLPLCFNISLLHRFFAPLFFLFLRSCVSWPLCFSFFSVFPQCLLSIFSNLFVSLLLCFLLSLLL